MHRYCSYISIVIVLLYTAQLATADGGVCTGYPKMFNGKPCASTTRYWDGQTGACGCGTGSSDPFSWQYTKLTAAGSAPIFGSGTWCGTGCGKCYKLTPTAVGASPQGTGAINTNSVVVKVTNLCPYTGNEQWCAYDTNSFGYDAHFDLMDENMNGLVTSMGWNNPEVTYEEVDCASSGYTDWNCQCASADTVVNTPTTSPTTPPKTPTKTPTTTNTHKSTTAPTAAPTTKPTKGGAKSTSAPTAAPTKPNNKHTTTKPATHRQ